VFVKICGVTHPADARAAAAAGASAIGINLVPTSRRAVGLVAARTIRAEVPLGVMAVGVVLGRPFDEIVELIDTLRLDAIQLHGDDALGLTTRLVAHGTTVIASVPVGDGFEAAALADHPADVVMLDGAVPGSGRPFDWELVGDLAERRRILLAGGLHPGNVAEAIRRVRPWGVDVASGVEAPDGRKDPALMARFVAAARGTAAAPDPEAHTSVHAALDADLTAYYDAEARAGLRGDPGPLRAGIRERGIDLFRREACRRILDVGAGPGTDTAALRDAGFTTVGVDLAPVNVVQMQASGLDAVAASLYALPFADATFDALWTMSTFVHVPHARFDAAMSELARVVRAGAPLVIGTWGGREFEGVNEFGDLRPYRFFSLAPHERWRSMLGRHGRVEHFETFPPATPGGWEYQLAVLRAA